MKAACISSAIAAVALKTLVVDVVAAAVQVARLAAVVDVVVAAVDVAVAGAFVASRLGSFPPRWSYWCCRR